MPRPNPKSNLIVGHIPTINGKICSVYRKSENSFLYNDLKNKQGLFFMCISKLCDTEKYCKALEVMVEAGTIPGSVNPDYANSGDYKWLIFDGRKQFICSITEDSFNECFTRNKTNEL